MLPFTLTAVLGVGGVLAGESPSAEVRHAIQAYERGDYPTAVSMLKPIVYDRDSGIQNIGDPWALYYFARLIQRGQGTTQDSAVACAMFNLSRREFLSRFQGLDLEVNATIAEVAEREVCNWAAPEAAREVNAIMSARYFLDGITRTVFDLDPGHWVTVDRTGFHVNLGTNERDTDLVSVSQQQVISLLHTPVEIPRGSTIALRHFLEFFGWTAGNMKQGETLRSLHWTVFEVVGLDIEAVTHETITEVIDSRYPRAELDERVRLDVELRPTDRGEVEWIVRSKNRRQIIE